MPRTVRLLLLGCSLFAATPDRAGAQYYYPFGYGTTGYGFGGWDDTPQGSILRGMGAYAEGAGVYNYDTAAADSINTNTAVRLNQYIWNSELEARRRYNAHQAARMNMNRDQYQTHQSRIRNNPSDGDIDSGAALNQVLHDLTDPKVMSGSATALKMADAKVNSRLIREIPFRDETDAITISLDELTDPKSWPAPLRSDAFKAEREAYQKAVDDALAEDKEGGSLRPATVAKVREAVSDLYRKVESTIPKTRQPDHLQAMNYLKGLAGLSRMLEKPNVEAVLGELEKIENTTIGNLAAFMHSYNLRFAPATTPRQVAAYRELYPVMASQRDKILGKPGEEQANSAPNAPVEDPTAIFNGLDPNHLHPRRPASPAPVQPPTPAPATPDKP